jgi:hypothetical protein
MMAENARTLFRHSIPVDGKTSISDKPAMIQVNEGVYNLRKTKWLTVYNAQSGSKLPAKLQVAVT